MPWQPMSMKTPPPEQVTSQNQALCGPKCFSLCFTRYSLPNAPWSTISLALTYFGVNSSSSALFSMYRGDGLLLSRQRLVFPVEPGVLSEHGRPAGRRRTARARSVLVARRGGALLFDLAVAGPHA